MKLYPHNQRSYDSAVKTFKKHNKTCIIQPTGTGKAVIIGKFITANPKAKHLLLAPGEHIAAEVRKHVDGAAFAFRTYKGLLSPKTLQQLKGLDYIYLDEFHRIGAESWGPAVMKLLGMNPQAKVLGTTATHIRFLDDNRDMAFELFKNNIASYISLNRAFLEGILYPPKYVSAIYSITQEHARLTAKIMESQHKDKELLIKELKARVIDWENSSGLDKILKKHLLPSRRKLIVFCAGLNEMKMAEETLLPTLKEIFGTVLALHVHSKFKPQENKQNLARFNQEDNITKVLFTVDMMNEGLHGKGISTVILLRETSSPIIWYQQIGRCFSVGQKEQPIILDLVNNFKNIQHNNFKADYEEEKAALDDTKIVHTRSRLDKEVTAVEFTDETQGIREILTSFESRIDGWEIGYSKAKAFFDSNGHLKVPKKIDRNLQIWVQKQQIAFRTGRLSTEKVALLTKIGIEWDNNEEERWHAKFLQLRKLIEEHGYLPRRRMDISLAGWLNRQKKCFQQNTLKKEHKHLLEEVISLENDRMVLWTNRLNRLEEYFAKHKKFPPSYGSSIQKDIDSVRASYRHGSLPQLVYNRLKELGFIFKAKGKRNTFEQTMEVFIKFIRENKGSLPARSTNLYLHQWLTKHCKQHRRGQLKKEHVDLFRACEAATGLKILPMLVITPAKQTRRA